MIKTCTKITLSYIFDPAHKFNHYSFDNGVHWTNGGGAIEVFDKASKGLTAEKDPNTAYDKGSDIESTHTSVKSGKATLINKFLGNSFSEVLDSYFATTASTNWDWGIKIDENLTVYNMQAAEFREFTETWASWDSDRKVIRYKATSEKMITWLEERLG